MSDRLSPIEELQAALAVFVDQDAPSVMFLTSFDEEVPTIARVIDGLDGESPGDVFFLHTAPVSDAATYVGGLVSAVAAQVDEVNDGREDDAPPLTPPPAACADPSIDPYERLRRLVAHMSAWLPPERGHRLVLALLPEHISNREAHARITGTLVPLGGFDAWMQRLRLVLRDDRQSPFLVDALRRVGVRGPCLYTTRVTVGDLADARALDAADPKLPPARRMQALLECAALDVALGRTEAALDKYGVLFQYYDEHKVPELKASVLHGLGDLMMRLERLPAARGHYLQSLDLAAEARSLHLILQAASAIGQVDTRLGAYAEADTSFTLGAGAAEKMGNFYARADLLEKAGEARWATGNARGAVEAWTSAANVAREGGYDPRLASVLVRLRDLSHRGGHRDVASVYDTELREVSARLSSSGGARG